MPNPITLFNTLSGKKEEFKPLNESVVTMYNCGPTVYNYAHIGNLRAYVFVDILRRTLEYSGYTVRQVMNITDVGHLTSDSDDGDDKMVKALKREGKPFTLEAMREVADFYADAFKKDLQALNCEIPHEMPRASDHIKEDIELVEILEKKGIAYKTSDGVYFDTSKFAAYGKLGNINLTGQLAGARVAVNSEKKNPADFTLWKKSSNDIGWESPWGKGFPGWHIECSAMSKRYLGQPFDIHTGGIDHIPVHHNNEIAQSEAAYEVPLARYWLHNEHLIVPSGKMAKSGDNFITLETIRSKGFSPTVYRYYLLGANYRTPLAFSFQALEAAKSTLRRLFISLAGMPDGGTVDPEYRKKFIEIVNDDLNTSNAVALLWALIVDDTVSKEDRRATILNFDEIFGLNLSELIKKHSEPGVILPEVIALENERKIARDKKDWKRSDELRDQILKLGYDVKDSDSGSIIEKNW